MKKQTVLAGIALIAFSLSAQDIIMNTVGKGDLPDSVDLAAITVECSSKCTISNVTLPDNAAKVILTVEYTDSTPTYEETITLTASQIGTSGNSFTTSTDLVKSTGNTFSFKIVDENDLVIGSTVEDEVQVLGSLVSKINSFTDSEVTNIDVEASDLVSTLALATEIKSDITNNLTDLNAELAENDHACSLSGGNDATDAAIGDYLECVMRAHYIDELQAAHSDVADPTVTENSDGSLTLALSDGVAGLCAETIWSCTITDTDSDGWELNTDSDEVELTSSEVDSATSTYANTLDSDFALVITLSNYSPLSSTDTTKNYTSVDLPAHPILTELLAATPSVSTNDNFDKLGLSTAIVTDLKANLSTFNTELQAEFESTDSCNDGSNTHSITSASTRPDVADYVECVMRSHYEDVATAVTVAASTSISGKDTCDDDIQGPVPSICSSSKWSCAISAKTPSGWAYTDNNDSATKPEIDAPNDDGTTDEGEPIDDATYTITATLADYSPSYSKSFAYANISIPGSNPTTTTSHYTFTGDVIKGVNKCTNQGYRVATFAEIQAKEKPNNCPGAHSGYPASSYTCSGSLHTGSKARGVYANNTTQTSLTCNNSWKSISWMKTYSGASKNKARVVRSNGSGDKLKAYNDGSVTTTNCRQSDNQQNPGSVWCVSTPTYSCD